MARSPAKFQVYGLERNYIHLGDYQFKIVISPKFKTGQDFGVLMLDSDRKVMNTEVDHWGRKLNVSFSISDDTPDGIVTVNVIRNQEQIGSFTFWVIKP